MAILKTPSLHSRGVYKLLTPWAAPTEHVYECIAIRNFRDFIERGDDVYKRFYEPRQLERSVYEEHLALNANIITLESETQAVIHVPDTYIAEYPDITGVAYKRMAISLILGPIPDSMDLTALKSNLVETASDTLGVDVTANEHVAPYSGMISQEEHEIMETRRQAAIKNRTTPYAELLRLQETVDQQAQQIAALSEWIIENGGQAPTP